MLFHDPWFLFVFLPIFFLGTYWLFQKDRGDLTAGWIVLCSLFFYSNWNIAFLPIILGSLLLNYFIASRIWRLDKHRSKTLYLLFGLIANLGLLFYFKYASWITGLLSPTNTPWDALPTILPLAISFFTFQQIAFLFEVQRQHQKPISFLNYSAFVTFFPQLIAGPIVYYEEVAPRIKTLTKIMPSQTDVAVGTSLFVAGLFKKLVLADTFALYATPVFDAAAANNEITFIAAWCGALSYTLQLYFDFSGYSDMALGIARVAGFKFPINFFSPYQALSIGDFWRRWHITLGRFIRDFLYFPLGGSKCSNARHYGNLFICMLLIGLWHGAGLTFVVWGAYNGLLLIIEQIWKRTFGKHLSLNHAFTWLLTMLCVVAGWVIFRADNLSTAMQYLTTMSGANGVALPVYLSSKLSVLSNIGVQFNLTRLDYIEGLPELAAISLGLLFVSFAPSTSAIFAQYFILPNKLLQSTKFAWRPNALTGAVLGLSLATVILFLGRLSEFLYFEF